MLLERPYGDITTHERLDALHAAASSCTVVRIGGSSTPQPVRIS
jgi:hypothetical protein